MAMSASLTLASSRASTAPFIRLIAALSELIAAEISIAMGSPFVGWLVGLPSCHHCGNPPFNRKEA